MAEPINLKCPSCDQILAAADESGLVNVLKEHLYEEHALDNLYKFMERRPEGA